ncbi:hypothetical protein B0H11DRAFT_2016559 [Mycena galericulata]|nr:hypothetical protein B0H11DRAFT_2016559 [Mycena galericulata]
MSCGNWKGRTVAAPTFADQKLRFTGKAPTDDSELAKDFHIAREKLEQIFKAAKTSDRHVQRGVFMEPFPGSPPSEMKLQFTHRLFEKIHKGDEEIEEGLLPEFTIGEWPVASEPAKQALAEMKYTHRVNYLAAFDATPEGNLIRPDAYEARLRGALAQIRFTLSNWYIGQKGENPPKDVFMANIAHIRVLAPPTKLSASPKRPRKKFTAQDDVSGDISPKKPRLGP